MSALFIAVGGLEGCDASRRGFLHRVCELVSGLYGASPGNFGDFLHVCGDLLLLDGGELVRRRAAFVEGRDARVCGQLWVLD